MKILIVNVYGAIRSTGKITMLQYQYMKRQGHDVKVCYRGIREPKIDNSDFIPIAGKLEPGIGRIAAWISGYEGYTHPFATRKLIKYTKEFNPDIVQLNILHGYFINSNQYISFLKEKDYNVCYTMMDEYAYMGKCPYSYQCDQFLKGCKGNCPNKMQYPKSYLFDRSRFIWESKRKAYEGFKHIVFTGPGWVVDRAKRSALLRNFRIEEIDEPVDFGHIFYPKDTTLLRKELNIRKENKVIVTVAQLSDARKGGKFVFDVAKKLENQNDITFVFVGCDVPGPFEVKNLIQIPFVKSQDKLAEYYSLGDLFICTSLADTMPNVCIDALGCGTPLAGFAEAGIPFVAPPEFGTFTPTYDIQALANVILNTPPKTQQRIADCHNYATSRFSPDIILKKLENIYNSLTNSTQ